MKNKISIFSIFFLLFFVFVSFKTNSQNIMKQKAEQFIPFKLTADISHLTDNQKKMLPLFFEAAKIMNTVVRFSEAASIALHGSVLIAKSDKYLNVTKIAEAIGGSRHHVAKVMQRLSKEGYIKSMRGPTGGFVMVKDPKKISFLDLYQAIEGRITVEECPFDRKDDCSFEKCLLGNILPEMTENFVDYMGKQFVADFL